MSTTTIRIEGDLKTRVAAAAQRAGQTTHAFILDAISKTVPWDAAKAYLSARANGAPARKPIARKLVK